jgi:uncharacterized membrane protein
MEQPQTLPAPSVASRLWPGLAVSAAALVLVSWLLNTPEGIMGKADAIGYAICHRIGSHSFFIGDYQLPLCARCTGIYLGALMGMVTLAILPLTRRGARLPLGGLPRGGVLFTLVGFVALMGVDGVNSYLNFFPKLPHLYEPQNWLRLITGTLDGITMAAFIVPVFNQTVWKDWDERPLGWRELGLLVLFGAVIIGLVLSDNPVVLYPLALLSSVGVLALLTALFTAILLIFTRRTNRVEHWSGALLPLLLGFTLTLIQIGVVDALRYAVFKSWGGLVFPG